MKRILPLLLLLTLTLTLLSTAPSASAQTVVIKGQSKPYLRELTPADIGEVNVHVDGNTLVLLSLARPDANSGVQHFYKPVLNPQRDSALENAFLLAEKISGARKVKIRFSKDGPVAPGSKWAIEIDDRIYYPLQSLTMTMKNANGL